MKVTRDKGSFRPITIVIETHEEAEIMIQALDNISDNTSNHSTEYEMWATFDRERNT